MPISVRHLVGFLQTIGMVVAPCSIKTMSEIAARYCRVRPTWSSNVAVRETPLHSGHLRTMTQLADMGAIIAARPSSTQDRRRHHQSRSAACSVRHRTSVVKRWQGGRG
jgi:4-hydroxy-3-polyprenylbenzoate decarboxylase